MRIDIVWEFIHIIRKNNLKNGNNSTRRYQLTSSDAWGC